jgi:ubiquinone/menaquinone biosynthesis C-methylase UbiE
MNAATPAGLLGDTTARDYSHKLRLFNAFAEPELRQAVASLGLSPGARVLDAGCGTGDALGWLSDAVAPDGTVIGIDLAQAHVCAARASASTEISVLQADVRRLPLAPSSVDVVWCVNTINHLRDRIAGLRELTSALAPGGRIALGQSSLLPEMFFAWDARLERLTIEAVRQYYRDRYSLSEGDLTDSRCLVGLLRRADLANVRVTTWVIERISPLDRSSERYLLEAVFRDTWGERLRPYLSTDDYAELTAACDPNSPAFALRRPDFHFLQTFTLVVGELA